MSNEWNDRLYVKQWEIEGAFGIRTPKAMWACGPTSLLTALKLLGNRRVTPERVFNVVGVSCWQQLGQLIRACLKNNLYISRHVAA